MKEGKLIILSAVILGLINWVLVPLLESAAYNKSFLSTLIYVKSDVLFFYRFAIIIIFILAA